MSIDNTQAEGRVRLLSAAIVVVVLAYLGLALTAAADIPWAYVAAFALVIVLEWLAERRSPVLVQLLKLSQLGPESRGLIQTLTFALLVSEHFRGWSTATRMLVVALAMALPLSRAVYLLVLFQVRGRLTRSIEVLNIDLGALATGRTVPTILTTQADRRLVHLASLVLMIGAVGAAVDVIWPFAALAVVYAACLLAGVAFVVNRLHGTPSPATWEKRALERIRSLAPEVVLYFSGSADSTYQLNMWLKPLADLGRPALVMVRERHVLEGLAPTDLPVACMPNHVTVMQAKLTTARVAFYAAHTSKNLHLLREPAMRHVFIGHGDSDKVSSVNPFARAYDEVWVAGRAGRDRWAAADVGVRDAAVVEVGRPQLEGISRGRQRAEGSQLTVLYAPTWEGWTDEDFSTSLTHMGPILVEALTRAEPSVRVIYKPHPFTGIRDQKARAAHHAIVELLAAANAVAPEPDPGHDLAELEAELDAPGLRPAEATRVATAWSEQFWSVVPDERHVVVDGMRPTIVDCFNHADVLVSDVSSVVSDFLFSQKPYVCANPRGTDPAVFVAENPSVAAGYLLGPDCAELADILSAIRGPDPQARERAALREYLLGPDEPPPIVRWRRAVDSLAATVVGRPASRAGDPDDQEDLSDAAEDADAHAGDELQRHGRGSHP